MGMPWRRLWFVVFASLAVSLLLVMPASASVLDEASKTIAGFLASFFLQIASLFVGILSFFVSLLINVASYNDFINMPGVVTGWTLVRDIANMFFVVILLVIAFGTILGYEQYHYKKLLPRFVGAAILINFSRLIVGVIIDAAQVIMMTFVNAIAQVGGGNFIQVFQLGNAWKVAQGSGETLADPLSQVMTGIFVMILMFVAAVLIGMFALLLVLRMVTLWVLIVLSPLAALLYTVPAGDFQKYYNEWWSKFKANVLMGPIVAFFLWLALTMAGDGTSLYGQLKGGTSSETGTALSKSGISGSLISTIENLSSFVIAAAIFAIAFKLASEMSSQAGMPGAGAITKAAGGLIKGGVGELTGYKFAGRALAPAWKQVKEIGAKTAPGAGLGKQLERGVLVAGAAAPGTAFGKEAKERLTAARWDDTQKAQQKLKRQTNEELEKKITLGTGDVSRAAALELTSRGQRLTPEQMKLVAREMEKDPKAFDQLKQSMKRSMPELAYDLSDATQRGALLKDPDVKHENLGVRAFTNAGGLVTNDGRALVGELLAEKGPKGFTKFVEDMKDKKAQEVVLRVMSEELIPQRVAATESSKARLEGTGGVKEQLAAKQRVLAASEARGEQTWSAQQERLTLTTDIQGLTKEKDTLESDVKAGSAMVEAHAKETGRPDQAVEHIADPTLRRKAMEAVLKKVNVNDLKEEALKNPQVIAGMHEAFGGRVGDMVRKMNPDKRKAFDDAITEPTFMATAPQQAIEVAIQVTSSLRGVTNGEAIRGALKNMTSQELGQLIGIAPEQERFVLEALLERTRVDNGRTLQSLPSQRGVNPATGLRLKELIENADAVQFGDLQQIVSNPINKWDKFRR